MQKHIGEKTLAIVINILGFRGDPCPEGGTHEWIGDEYNFSNFVSKRLRFVLFISISHCYYKCCNSIYVKFQIIPLMNVTFDSLPVNKTAVRITYTYILIIFHR